MWPGHFCLCKPAIPVQIPTKNPKRRNDPYGMAKSKASVPAKKKKAGAASKPKTVPVPKAAAPPSLAAAALPGAAQVGGQAPVPISGQPITAADVTASKKKGKVGANLALVSNPRVTRGKAKTNSTPATKDGDDAASAPLSPNPATQAAVDAQVAADKVMALESAHADMVAVNEVLRKELASALKSKHATDTASKKRKPEVTEVTSGSSDSDKSAESDSSSDSTDTGNDDDEDSSSEDEKPSSASPGSRKKKRPTGGKQPIGAIPSFKVFNSTAALTDVTATTLPRHDGSTDNQHCTLQQHG